MKPKNFPGRKNDRRQIAVLNSRALNSNEPLSKDLKKAQSKIVSPESARAERSKKDRRNSGTIRHKTF